MNAEFRDALPPQLRQFVEPVKDFNPQFQLPFSFAHQKWAVEVRK